MRHAGQKTFNLFFLLIGAALLAGNNLASAATNFISTVTTTNAAKYTYIVTLRAEADQDGCVNEHQIIRGRSFRHALNGFVADLDDTAVARLKQDQRVLAVEQDAPIRPAEVVALPPTETIPGGLLRMGITNFPVVRINGQSSNDTNQLLNVDVAVLDTGIDTTSLLLNVVQSVGFADPGYDGWDWHGHGTHVAGTIGAGDLGYGVVGVAPFVRLWSVQVMGPTQSSFVNFLAGMDYIVQNADQIEVVNASLEGLPTTNQPTFVIEMAVSNVVSHGIVFVAAAGNDSKDVYGNDGIYGTSDDILPAAVPEALTVSAVTPWVQNIQSNGVWVLSDNGTNADVIPSFSNFSRSVVTNSRVHSPGKAIDLAAPGVNILSLYVNGSASIQSGTSMAAAHVSGLVALYIAANGRATNAAGVYKIRQALIDNALPQTQWRSYPNTGDRDTNHEGLAIASENWVPPAWITQPAKTAQGFRGSFAVVPGYTYTLQTATNLTRTNGWTSLFSTDGAGSVVTTAFTNTSGGPARFYRLTRTATP